MGLSSPGIGSNLDVNGIVTKLMQVESQPLTTLATKEASYQAKLSAYGNLSGALGAFQNASDALNNISTFRSLIAATSDSSVLTGAATSQAVAGSYNINVTQLAQSQTLSSAGLTSASATIGLGGTTTLTFEAGSISGGKLVSGRYASDPSATPPDPAFSQDANRGSKSITIDSSNNSLQGIRDAINKAGIGVTATIISDGGATPYHLVLSSDKTGAKSSLKISVQGDSAISGLLAYDPAGTQNLTQATAAQDTALTINGIAVNSPTATVTDAIQGVTLNVAKIGTSTLSVSKNTSAVQSAVGGLVKAYNDFNTTLKSLTGYDPATKRGGPLIGDSAAQAIQSQLRKLLATPTATGNSSFNSLAQIGLSFQKDGSLSLDTSKLQKAFDANPTDVAALFTSLGTTTDSLVAYKSATNTTAAGTSAVFVKNLATQGDVVGSAALANTAIDSSNNGLTVTVDGVTTTVNLLSNPSYSPAALATQVQSAINGSAELSAKGIAVTASIDAGGHLRLLSNRYGSVSAISVSGSSMPTLFGTPTSSAGLDIAGNIGGIAGAGSGQTLSGASGSLVDGLKLEITGGQGNTDRGTVTLSRGLGYQLSKLIDGFVGSGGLIKSRTDGINRSIKDIGNSRESISKRLADVEKRYRAQFTSLDTTISKMNTTSTFLTQQLAQLANLSK